MRIHQVLADKWPMLDEVSLVMHTSCVNFGYKDLLELAKLEIPWLVPDNVRMELELLRDRSSCYRDQARLILEQARKWDRLGITGEGRHWDLEQLYQNRAGSLQPDSIDWGTLVFLFGNDGKMYEFAGNCVPMPGHYLLWRGGGTMSIRSMGSGELETLRAEARNYWNGSHVRRLSDPIQVEPLKNLRRIRCLDAQGREVHRPVPGRMFNGTDKHGSFARLYTLTAWKNQFVKIYSDGMALVGDSRDKLRALVEIAPSLEHLPLAMPQVLLDTEDGKARIGYSMPALRGRPLVDFYFVGWEGYDLPEILRQIAWILLELHCRDILVNDLSYNNLLVDETGHVSCADCDSYQCGTFPGGRITKSYRHPEIRDESCRSSLHQPRHECFAFAVLAYQCAMLADPLSVCGGHPDPDWNNTTFPLDWDTKTSTKVNGQILRDWVGQDLRFRRVMADIFHLRADHSIGAILRELELD